MSKAPRDIHPSASIPDMTPLSIAFPMNFESSPTPRADPRQTSAKPTNPPRSTHRHDAGK